MIQSHHRKIGSTLVSSRSHQPLPPKWFIESMVWHVCKASIHVNVAQWTGKCDTTMHTPPHFEAGFAFTLLKCSVFAFANQFCLWFRRTRPLTHSHIMWLCLYVCVCVSSCPFLTLSLNQIYSFSPSTFHSPTPVVFGSTHLVVFFHNHRYSLSICAAQTHTNEDIRRNLDNVLLRVHSSENDGQCFVISFCKQIKSNKTSEKSRISFGFFPYASV